MTEERKPLELSEARKSIHATITEMHYWADELDRAIEHMRTTRARLNSVVKKLHRELDR